MKDFYIYCGIGVFIASFFVVPRLFYKPCNEECFRKKYRVKETSAVFVGYDSRGRGTTEKYEFKTDNGIFYSEVNSFDESVQIGDAFYILYDVGDPNNNYILFEKPVVPPNVIEIEGEIIKLNYLSRTNRVEVLMSYTVESYSLKRIQYFPINNLEILQKWFKEKKKVIIDVVPENARRSFLNIEKTINKN